MFTPPTPLFRARLLAGFGTLALLTGIGLAASRPVQSAGGPIPVTIANAPLTIVPADVAAPTQPVGVQQFLMVSSGFGSNVVYTVPAGKRLVIETVTATTETQSNNPNAYSIIVAVNNFATFASFPAVPAGSLAVGSQSVRLYADPGTTVIGRAFGRSTASDTIGVGISGYLVDAPGPAAEGIAASPNPSFHGLATQ